MEQGRLFVISGPSGTGKGTICSKLMESGDFELSVSMTTRRPREGEVHGVSYYFVTHEEFQKTVDEGGLLEWARIYANSYGTPKAPVLKKLAEGKDVILEIEMQGAMQVKQNYPQAVLIFVLPPSLAELKKRLTSRGTETPEQIEMRTKATLSEIATIKDYDYFIINDRLDSAIGDVRAIIRAEHLRTSGQAEEIIKRYENEGV